MISSPSAPKETLSQPVLSSSQLFLDDRWIADSIRLERVFHQPRKYRTPVLVPDRPYEVGCVGYGSMLHRGGRFHLWYTIFNLNERNKVCYAVSDDGVHFEKPDLGIYEWQGSRANNICIMPDEPGVIDCVTIIEDELDPEWPLKAVYWEGTIGPRDGTGLWAKRGLVAARSKDGFRWDKTPGNFCHGWGDRTCALPARDNGKFVLYTRQPTNPYRSRVVYRIESEDMVNWSDPVVVFKQGVDDHARYEPYSLQGFAYSDMYVGFLERMHNIPDRLDTEIVFSRDGLDWQRGRKQEPFLPPSLPSDWDADWTNMLSSAPVLKDNRLWFYYGGRQTAGGPSHQAFFPFNESSIGLAILRIDGFASLRALEKEGWVETPAFVWDGGELAINGDARSDLNAPRAMASGEIRVEICDEDGNPLPGFTREDCVPMNDTTAHEPGSCARVQWVENPSCKGLAGRTIKIRFHLRDAHLFAFKSIDS